MSVSTIEIKYLQNSNSREHYDSRHFQTYHITNPNVGNKDDTEDWRSKVPFENQKYTQLTFTRSPRI